LRPFWLTLTFATASGANFAESAFSIPVWEKYRDETERHVQILHDVCAQMQLDPEEQSPGRKIVHDMGMSSVAAIEAAGAAGDPSAAEILACECVSLAEQTDHSNWEPIGECAKKLSAAEGNALKEAHKEVEEQEDEHYYHSCCRRPKSASTSRPPSAPRAPSRGGRKCARAARMIVLISRVTHY